MIGERSIWCTIWNNIIADVMRIKMWTNVWREIKDAYNVSVIHWKQIDRFQLFIQIDCTASIRISLYFIEVFIFVHSLQFTHSDRFQTICCVVHYQLTFFSVIHLKWISFSLESRVIAYSTMIFFLFFFSNQSIWREKITRTQLQYIKIAATSEHVFFALFLLFFVVFSLTRTIYRTIYGWM